MKYVYSIFILLFFSFGVTAAQQKAADNVTISDKAQTAEVLFDDIFPKPSELQGGATGWFASDLTKTVGERFVVYEKNYSYYSTVRQRILDIERSNAYSVSVRIFACENLEVANAKYASLAAVDEKIVSKKMTSPAPFGERGVLLALPSGGRSADYYITFIFRTFVVQVYSDDGFAQIDMADDVEKRMGAYLKSKGIDFYLNKINLELGYGSSKYNEQVKFSGDDVSVVVLGGRVFDIENKPLSGAKITARETGQSTVTDDNGEYSMEITSGWGKAIYLSKMVFMPVLSKDTRVLTTGLYPLKVQNGLTTTLEGVLDIFMAGDKIVGKFEDKADGKIYGVSGSVQKDKISFAMSCPVPSAVCRRVFQGTKKGDVVKGKVSGGGLKGSWQIIPDVFQVFKENKYLRDINILASGLNFNNGKITDTNTGSGNLYNMDEKSFIKLAVEKDGVDDPFYFKKGVLVLKIHEIKLEKTAQLVLYEIMEKDGGDFTLKESATLATLNPQSSYVSINADISSLLRQPNSSGYAIGLKGGGKKGMITADIAGSYGELDYYRDKNNYKPLIVVAGKVESLQGADFAANANKIKQDGAADLVLKLEIAMQGRQLEHLEINGNDGNSRRWNTNPFDIYPAIAVTKDGQVLNDDDGSINIKLENPTEIFYLYLYKGSFAEDNNPSFTINAVIGGKTYESGLININK